MEAVTNIAYNLERILQRIDRAARRAGRDSRDVRLVVVSKTHPVETIRAAVQAGVCCLGESYVEEAVTKIQAFGTLEGFEWHMVGHVQSRKAKLVCQYFDYVHSLDRLKLASLLDRYAVEQKRRLPVLLECNVSGEESKYGWPAWQEENWPALIEPVTEIIQKPNLQVRGLMTMAPYFNNPELARPYFIKLRRLREFFKSNFPMLGWEELSMGMSGDFEPAIEEGATCVRIGTAIFGPREV